MDETADAQGTAIGIGTVVALAFFAYGRYLDETIVGVETTTLAMAALAATFVALALLHGAYGRRDLALAHGLAAAGLGLFTFAASGPQALIGLGLLAASGAYIALVTVRTRDAARDAADSAGDPQR
ncbi:hypothetical protein [Natronorubrum aibiense]|uniref:Uncharacterized protein n=1 Tax=Natronorubrum aibiense TaxID=348826 RepID=A0A5P9P0P1_9EURY|nr:hypothetical protein [Natronorubrum aibiense]QFU81663.1 hypothetical protein GCU68_03350 [Natronorubrum aibiense]